jgi:hypothetical protein
MNKHEAERMTATGGLTLGSRSTLRCFDVNFHLCALPELYFVAGRILQRVFYSTVPIVVVFAFSIASPLALALALELL